MSSSGFSDTPKAGGIVLKKFVRRLILIGRKPLSDEHPAHKGAYYPPAKRKVFMAVATAVCLTLSGDHPLPAETPVTPVLPGLSLLIPNPFRGAVQFPDTEAAPMPESTVLGKEEFGPPEPEPQSAASIDTAPLNQLLASYGEGVSVYYQDLASGFEYAYNGDERYFAASVIKAPYVLYVYTLAREGKADLDERLIYRSAHYAKGTGEIKNKLTGTAFSIRELLSYAIRYSDNIALRMLIDRYPVEGFAAYAAKWGADPEPIGNVTGADMTAREAGLYAEQIYHFIEQEAAGGLQLKKDLMSTRNPMIRSAYPIARKYGWANRSFHDMAIVYAPSPYILAVMSDHDSGSRADYAMFAEISEMMERFSLNHFAGSMEYFPDHFAGSIECLP
ncbi:MAG: hypothetical protein K0R57_6619 [Paenibacillaceae bacterium]|jgi:beta-lactamase class A|nr:hypothetical protein [Paenibacillaceae bacterium]